MSVPSNPEHIPQMEGSELPAFENTETHFKAYLEVREIIAAEGNYRRERQWELVKWTATIFVAIIAGLLALQARADLILGWWILVALATALVLIGALASVRIVHDANVHRYRSWLCEGMDQIFGIKINDKPFKFWPGLRMKFKTAELQKERPKFKLIPSGIVATYLAFIWGLVLVACIVMLGIRTKAAAAPASCACENRSQKVSSGPTPAQPQVPLTEPRDAAIESPPSTQPDNKPLPETK